MTSDDKSSYDWISHVEGKRQSKTFISVLQIDLDL